MKLWMKSLCGVAIGLLSTFQAQALDLVEAYTLARANDPTFKAAYHAYQAGKEYKTLGRANLLPMVTASYSRFRNDADIEYQNSLFSRTEEREYNSETASVQLRQPLINFDAYARYKQGLAQTSMSEQEFAIRDQELILRVFNRYAAVLYAKDMLSLAQRKKAAYEEQMQANLVMYKHGEGTKTDILESQARYDLADADIVEARDNVSDAQAALDQILGRTTQDIDPLIKNFTLLPLNTEDLSEWEAVALQNNVELNIQRYAVEVAQQELKRSQAGHLPKLDAVASWNNNTSDTTNTYNQEATIRSVGLQVTVPIFSGGATSARVRQSQANLYRAKEQFDETANKVTLELQQQFNLVSNAKRKLKAYRTAVNSAELLVHATKKSIKGGTRTNIDVLNAESQLFEAKADLLLARYNYLQSYLNFKKAAGTLVFDDLEDVSSRFQGY
nr:TolC family outer membrane protein [uncultured Methylophaga sp.]